MKLFTVFFSILLVVSFANCDDTASSSSSNEDDISLSGSLLTAGNTVPLHTSSGTTVNATTTDTSGDGSAEGLDFDGDATVEISYVFDIKSSARDVSSVAFRFVGSDTVYYFLLDAGDIVMRTTADLDDEETEAITLVVDSESETITGIVFVDKDGNEETVELTVPFSIGVTPKILGSNPANGATIGGSTTITVYLSRAVGQVSLGGSLASQAEYEIGNSATGKTNDLLTFTPTEAWTEGADQNLILNLVSASGADFTPVTLVYTVDVTGPVLVDSSFEGDDFAGGSEDLFFTFDEAVTLENISVNLNFSGNYTMELSTDTIENDTLNLILDGGESWSNDCGGGTVDISIEDEFGNTGTENLTGLTLVGAC